MKKKNKQKPIKLASFAHKGHYYNGAILKEGNGSVIVEVWSSEFGGDFSFSRVPYYKAGQKVFVLRGEVEIITDDKI